MRRPNADVSHKPEFAPPFSLSQESRGVSSPLLLRFAKQNGGGHKKEEKLINVSMKELLEAGVHFGHQTKRWNPKMLRFIFGDRSDIYIIDLEKTQKLLIEACDFLRGVAAQGGNVLFVGTKRQAKSVIREEAIRCGAFYVDRRWLGGTLTNFETIRKSTDKLEKLKNMDEAEAAETFTKKERSVLNKKKVKLEANLEGILKMNKLPGALYVVDAGKESIAIAEAKKLSIPAVAMIDTNTDPDDVPYPIPSNDDAMKSIRLITQVVADAVLEGKNEFNKGAEIEKAVEEKEEAAEEIEKAEEGKE